MTELKTPLTLDEALSELEALNLPPERVDGLKANIYFSFGEYDKGHEAIEAYFLSAVEGLKRTQSTVECLKTEINDLGTTDARRQELQEELNIIVKSMGGGACNECRISPGVRGKWGYDWLGQLICLC